MNYNIKANRIFSKWRQWAWIFTLVVAFGGLWVPKLGLLVFIVIFSLVGMSFFRGRYWCGNFCPHGSLYDSALIKYTRNAKIPSFLRSKIVVVAFFGWFGFNLTRAFINAFSLLGTDQFLDRLGMIFASTYLNVVMISVPLGLLIAPRVWCQFCPMGTIQTLMYKLGKLVGVAKKTDVKVTISNKDLCHSCGKCSRVCPMQLTPHLEFSDKNQFDHETCIRCATCVEHCPAGILSIGTEKEAEKVKLITNNTGAEMRQKIQARISNITHLTDDITEYIFLFKIPKEVYYKAGQFILVNLTKEPKMNRAYTISSYNEDNRSLSVTVKRMPNGYGANMMHENFKVGDEIELEGPMGHELLVDSNAEKVLLVGGGIGVTPFLPIVTDIVRNNSNTKEVKLVYGVNKENEFIYNEQFDALEANHDQFEMIRVAAFDENYQGRKGFVTDVIKDMNLEGYKVYMCGPKPMVNATSAVLKKMDVDEKDIFIESA